MSETRSQSHRFIEPLPPRPSLEMQQKRAKELVRAAWRGDAEAIERVRTLHPSPPPPEEMKLSDAQLVVARGYGFRDWPAMKQKIESLTLSPVERFVSAVKRGDVAETRALLERHAEVRDAVNAPLFDFGGRAVRQARDNLPLLDVLLEHGADLNLKSDWWAGGFGLMEYDCTPEQAALLIARGAVVDVWAAANLGMLDRLRELLDADPSLVHARGGDGKTPLHCAASVEIADFLIDRGADLEARCVDHQSRPIQYLCVERPAVARRLIEAGAWFDIFVAVALRDAALVERALADDPEALDHRTGEGRYDFVKADGRPATLDEIGDHRGNIYRWVFGHFFTAYDAARKLGFDDIAELLLRHANPVQRFVAACTRGDGAARVLLDAHPDLLDRLPAQHRNLVAQRAFANDAAAVELLLDLGFAPNLPGIDGGTPLHIAAFLGNPTMVRLLLRHDPPLGVQDPTHCSTPMGWCVFGSVHGWNRDKGEYPATAALLAEAGEAVDAAMLPTGNNGVDATLSDIIRKRGL